MNATPLHMDYKALAEDAYNSGWAVLSKIREALTSLPIPLASPAVFRVKAWSAIEDKLNRTSINIKSLNELNDILGLRIVTVYQHDVLSVASRLEAAFSIIKVEDTVQRFALNQFGYSSVHIIVDLNKDLKRTPSKEHLRRAEIQVRSMTQHLWATASHELQYKNDALSNSGKRTLFRISALLEQVDSELENLRGSVHPHNSKADDF